MSQLSENHEKIDVSAPRWMYWNDDVDSSTNCPRCGAPLIKQFHSYLLIVKEEKNFESFVTGNDGGSFCLSCLVVVLDKSKFEGVAIAGGASSSSMFTVAGIVDFDAIPEDKRNIHIGKDDNPIPLVKFINNGGSNKGRRKATK